MLTKRYPRHQVLPTHKSSPMPTIRHPIINIQIHDYLHSSMTPIRYVLRLLSLWFSIPLHPRKGRTAIRTRMPNYRIFAVVTGPYSQPVTPF
jgi:hypothetical protein